MKMRLKSIEE
jgi:hypothetical protein